MSGRTFVYALHIATTPEKLWEALTSNEFWQQYWNGEWRIESDWRLGSPLRFFTGDGKFFSEGQVIETNPPNSLTYTWPNPDDQRSSSPPPPERLSWRISASGPGTVMLQLTHEHVAEKYYPGVGQGWAAILSSLKSLLETGKPLAYHPKGGNG